MNLGKKIKELRISHEESQQKLAEVLNVSFQSVSKWENNQSCPEISMLKLISEHYDVSVDYLINDKLKKDVPQNLKLKQLIIKSTVNRISSFQVWTDFEYHQSIAPLSKLSDTRRRTGAQRLNSPSDDSNMFTIAVDKEGRISYAGKKSGWSYSSPCDAYYSKSSLENSRMECFILQPTYLRYDTKNRDSWFHCNDYEFVIPENGFVMVFNPNDCNYSKIFDVILERIIANRGLQYEYKQRIIKPEDFITYDLMDDELKEIKIELLEDEKIQITYPQVLEQEVEFKEGLTLTELKEYIDKSIERKLSLLKLQTNVNTEPNENLVNRVQDVLDELEDLNELLEEFLSDDDGWKDIVDALKVLKNNRQNMENSL